MNKTTKIALKSFLLWLEVRALISSPVIYFARLAAVSLLAKSK